MKKPICLTYVYVSYYYYYLTKKISGVKHFLCIG